MRNPGAAFGIAQGLTVAFTVVAAVVVVVILRLSRRLRSTAWAVALGLVLGGAVGNLVDRVFRAPAPGRGHVVDFLELPHWPVFNLADSAIVAAAVLMVLLSARGLSYDGSPAAGSLSEPPVESRKFEVTTAPSRASSVGVTPREGSRDTGQPGEALHCAASRAVTCVARARYPAEAPRSTGFQPHGLSTGAREGEHDLGSARAPAVAPTARIAAPATWSGVAGRRDTRWLRRLGRRLLLLDALLVTAALATALLVRYTCWTATW